METHSAASLADAIVAVVDKSQLINDARRPSPLRNCAHDVVDAATVGAAHALDAALSRLAAVVREQSVPQRQPMALHALRMLVTPWLVASPVRPEVPVEGESLFDEYTRTDPFATEAEAKHVADTIALAEVAWRAGDTARGDALAECVIGLFSRASALRSDHARRRARFVANVEALRSATRKPAGYDGDRRLEIEAIVRAFGDAG